MPRTEVRQIFFMAQGTSAAEYLFPPRPYGIKNDVHRRRQSRYRNQRYKPHPGLNKNDGAQKCIHRHQQYKKNKKTKHFHCAILPYLDIKETSQKAYLRASRVVPNNWHTLETTLTSEGIIKIVNPQTGLTGRYYNTCRSFSMMDKIRTETLFDLHR